MQASALYQSIYTYFGDATPISADCGLLCGKACCESDEYCSDSSGSIDNDTKETGMYLFPGEKPLFLNDPNYKVIPSEFTYGTQRADIVICRGPCVRDSRPLSCRIFPLIPYYRMQTGLKIIRDPRALPLCPLAGKKAYPFLSRTFIHKTESVFRLLIKFSEVRLFLEGLSDILDDYLKFEPKGALF